MEEKIIDGTSAELHPGDPERCQGNGEHPGFEICCDECNYFLDCFPNPNWREMYGEDKRSKSMEERRIEMIYTMDEIKAKVKTVADDFDIEEILLFGSYFDHVPNEQSDVDLLVKYGDGCQGMDRIQFMLDLEERLQKKVDVINIKFAPEFVAELDLNAEGRLIYAK